jgi:hypothetical protein
LTIEKLKLRNDIAQRVVANAFNLTIQLSKIEPRFELRCDVVANGTSEA